MGVLDTVALALTLLVGGLATGGYVAALWSPFLLLRRVRPLFRLGPTGNLALNYVLAAASVGVVHVTVLATGTVVFGSFVSAPEVVLYTGFGLGALWMAVAGVGLPATGHDWKSGGYVTELVLLGGGVWYTLVTTVPPLFLFGAGLGG